MHVAGLTLNFFAADFTNELGFNFGVEVECLPFGWPTTVHFFLRGSVLEDSCRILLLPFALGVVFKWWSGGAGGCFVTTGVDFTSFVGHAGLFNTCTTLAGAGERFADDFFGIFPSIDMGRSGRVLFLLSAEELVLTM